MKHSNGSEQSATACIINALMMQYVKVMATISAHSHSSYAVSVYDDLQYLASNLRDLANAFIWNNRFDERVVKDSYVHHPMRQSF